MSKRETDYAPPNAPHSFQSPRLRVLKTWPLRQQTAGGLASGRFYGDAVLIFSSV
jgi:hypothetical protein